MVGSLAMVTSVTNRSRDDYVCSEQQAAGSDTDGRPGCGRFKQGLGLETRQIVSVNMVLYMYVGSWL